MATKVCNGCGTELPATPEHFAENKKCTYGVVSTCRKCRKAREKEYRANNVEKIRLRKAKWLRENKPYMDEYFNEYREVHKEDKRKYDEVYYQKQETIDRRTVRNRKRWENPHFRLASNMSKSISRSLHGGKEGLHWETLINYDCQELMAHLEAQFQPGMTWDNYGLYGWHIDHIKPKSLFNFTSYDDQEFKDCWAISNLQPLWAADNIRKSNKFEDDQFESNKFEVNKVE